MLQNRNSAPPPDLAKLNVSSQNLVAIHQQNHLKFLSPYNPRPNPHYSTRKSRYEMHIPFYPPANVADFLKLKNVMQQVS